MGLTVLDTGVLIGLVDAADAHHAGATAALETELGARSTLLLPSTAYAELRVRPWQLGPEHLAVIDRVVERLEIEIVRIDAEVADIAARVRASAARSVKLPDAIVLAVALHLDADRLLTTDRRWPVAADVGFGGEIRVV